MVYAMPERAEPVEAVMYALDAWDDRFGGKPRVVFVATSFLSRLGLTKVRDVPLDMHKTVRGTYAWMPVD